MGVRSVSCKIATPTQAHTQEFAVPAGRGACRNGLQLAAHGKSRHRDRRQWRILAFVILHVLEQGIETGSILWLCGGFAWGEPVGPKGQL
jgi:hypothetical protein